MRIVLLVLFMMSFLVLNAQSKKELQGMINQLKIDSLQLSELLKTAKLANEDLEMKLRKSNESISSKDVGLKKNQILIDSFRREIQKLNVSIKNQITSYQKQIDSIYKNQKSASNNQLKEIKMEIVKKGDDCNDFLKDWDFKNIKYNKRQVEGGYEYEFIDVFLGNELYYTIYRDGEPDDKCFCYVMENTISSLSVHSGNVKIPNTTLRVGSTVADFNKLYGSKLVNLNMLEGNVYLEAENYVFDLGEIELNYDFSKTVLSNNSLIPQNLKIEQIFFNWNESNNSTSQDFLEKLKNNIAPEPNGVMKKVETDLIPQQIKQLSNDCIDCYWYKSIDGFSATDDLYFIHLITEDHLYFIYDQVEYLIPLKYRSFEEGKTHSGKLIFEGSGFSVTSNWSNAGLSMGSVAQVEVKLKDKIIMQMSSKNTYPF